VKGRCPSREKHRQCCLVSAARAARRTRSASTAARASTPPRRPQDRRRPAREDVGGGVPRGHAARVRPGPRGPQALASAAWDRRVRTAGELGLSCSSDWARGRRTLLGIASHNRRWAVFLVWERVLWGGRADVMAARPKSTPDPPGLPRSRMKAYDLMVRPRPAMKAAAKTGGKA
jgi:hypothetical protein